MDDVDVRVAAVERGEVDEDVVASMVGDALDDPRRVDGWGRTILASAELPVVVSVGHQLVGAAAMAMERPEDAAAAFRQAVDVLDDDVRTAAAGTSVAARSAACLSSLAPSLMYQGLFDEAERALALAGERCTTAQRPRIDGQHAAVLDILGRPHTALALYASSVPALEAAGDLDAEGRARTNRATLLARMGRTHEAKADLERARELSGRRGAALSAAMIEHNLGWVASLEGDVVAALEAFDEYDRQAAELGIDSAVTMRTRADVLLSAGLPVEARSAAVRAAAIFDQQGEVIGAGQARLAAARGALWSGDVATAAHLASRAVDQLAAQDREVSAAAATALLAEVELARGVGPTTSTTAVIHTRTDDGADSGRSPVQLDLDVVEAGATGPVVALDDVARAADVLAAVGLPDDHARARASAVRLALRLGDRVAARAQATRLTVAASPSAASSSTDEVATIRTEASTVSVRAHVLGAEARARLAAADGDVTAALRHVAAGLELVDVHRAAIGATDLRTGASSLAADLAFFGLSLAVEHETADRVWWWTEQTRAASLRRPPVRPPDDEDLRTALARLRDAVANVDRAVGAGEDPAELVERQQQLEQEVTALARRARDDGTGAGGDLQLVDVGALLVHRVLVELLAVGERLYGLVVSTGDAVEGGPAWMAGSVATSAVPRGADRDRAGDGTRLPGGPTVRLHDLGGREEAVRLAEQADAALRRLAFGHGSSRVLDAVRAGFEDTVRRLDALLVAPLLDAAGPAARDSGVVIVPSSVLHTLPWAAMPSLQGRTVEVAPSATIWARAARRRAEVAGKDAVVALVAGPDLAHADDEVAELAALHPRTVVLGSRESTAEATLGALDEADVAHLACHGEWRADQPLFSALRLADGPLTVHDLTGIDHPPHTILLSACELGRAQARPGEELLGLATSLLGMGAATVVASSVPVADAAVRALMTDVHGHLAEGASPAAALRDAAAVRLDADDHTPWAAAASMLVLGAG